MVSRLGDNTFLEPRPRRSPRVDARDQLRQSEPVAVRVEVAMPLDNTEQQAVLGRLAAADQDIVDHRRVAALGIADVAGREGLLLPRLELGLGRACDLRGCTSGSA